LLGYDSNSRAYRVFHMSSSCVEIIYDAVFDETNSSQMEKVDLDLADDEEAPCDCHTPKFQILECDKNSLNFKTFY
jgi:hypothetical protein